MSDFNEMASALLRQKARTQLLELEFTVREMQGSLSMQERVELAQPMSELRRLLHATVPPAAMDLPENVVPIGPRLVASGRSGPAFGARGGVEIAVGPNGLRPGESR